jgi:hypothetical protein
MRERAVVWIMIALLVGIALYYYLAPQSGPAPAPSPAATHLMPGIPK